MLKHEVRSIPSDDANGKILIIMLYIRQCGVAGENMFLPPLDSLSAGDAAASWWTDQRISQSCSPNSD